MTREQLFKVVEETIAEGGPIYGSADLMASRVLRHAMTEAAKRAALYGHSMLALDILDLIPAGGKDGEA